MIALQPFMVRTVHPQSRKSGILPPPPLEVAKLAEQSRNVLTAKIIPKPEKKVDHPFLKRRLTAETIEAIVARRKAGEKVKVLCKEYGISESGLGDLMVRAEAPIRTTPITQDDIDDAVRLYESGLNVKQVVRQLGYSICTIRRVLHERDVTRRMNISRNVKDSQ